jgi:DNA-binding NarL/FixJ family response regulator
MTQDPTLHRSETRPIRVLLVCHERVIRAALRALIDGQDAMQVIGEVGSLDTALATILSEKPDVTLFDPDSYSSRDVADVLRTAMTKTRIILLTSSPDSTSISEALEIGAVGLVLKQQAPEVLIKAITKVHAGELWLDRAATARLLAELTRAQQPDRGDPEAERAVLLTRRERQVITLVGEGLRNSQIAERLCISEVTVRNHLTSTFRKLEVENRFQLVIYAFQHGLATLPGRTSSVDSAVNRSTVNYRQKTS